MANGKRGFVTRGECQVAMLTVGTDIVMIKKALVGEDLRGGIVKDMATVSLKLDQLIKDTQDKQGVSLKWKIAIFSTAASSITALVGVFVKVLGA